MGAICIGGTRSRSRFGWFGLAWTCWMNWRQRCTSTEKHNTTTASAAMQCSWPAVHVHVSSDNNFQYCITDIGQYGEVKFVIQDDACCPKFIIRIGKKFTEEKHFGYEGMLHVHHMLIQYASETWTLLATDIRSPGLRILSHKVLEACSWHQVA